MAWFFEPTIDQNVEYEMVVRYDCKQLSVARVWVVRIDPVATTDVTKHWRGNPIVENAIERIGNALQLH